MTTHSAAWSRAEALCLVDESWEHHDQTDDFPCSSCIGKATAETKMCASCGCPWDAGCGCPSNPFDPATVGEQGPEMYDVPPGTTIPMGRP